jgi:hypothetical protein
VRHKRAAYSAGPEVSGDQIKGVLLLAVFKVVQEVANSALEAIIPEAKDAAVASAHKVGFESPRASILDGDHVAVISPEHPETLLQLHTHKCMASAVCMSWHIPMSNTQLCS